jgi:hypothetical protein
MIFIAPSVDNTMWQKRKCEVQNGARWGEMNHNMPKNNIKSNDEIASCCMPKNGEGDKGTNLHKHESCAQMKNK